MRRLRKPKAKFVREVFEPAFEGNPFMRAWIGRDGEEMFALSPLMLATRRAMEAQGHKVTFKTTRKRVEEVLRGKRFINETMMAQMREFDAEQRANGYCIEGEATADARIALAVEGSE